MEEKLSQFRELGISEEILKALEAKGFQEPTEIQKLTIPRLLTGEHDLIAQAQTGTGKTAAFGIPILDTIKTTNGKVQALILSPTRELCMQIAEEIDTLRGNSKLKIAPFYGGQNILVQLDKLKSGIDVAIGTPGRVMDLMRRGKLPLDNLQFMVLDEADEMLDMGFIDDIRTILAESPQEKRMLLFSATMPEPIKEIAQEFMRKDYEHLKASEPEEKGELTDQYWYEIRRENKLELLARIIELNPNIYGMVFCRTKADVDELAEHLMARGLPIDALHGDIPQGQRTRVINSFKRRRFRMLIATDVAARGIDVNDLTHVINYSMPQSLETYVHRIGRTGRAGKKGTAITFATPGEIVKFDRMKRQLKNPVKKLPLPTGAEIVEAKKQHLAEELHTAIANMRHTSCLSFAEELLTMGDHPAEVLAAILSLRFGEELVAETWRDLGANSKKTEKVMKKIRFGIGRNDGLTVPELLQVIFEATRLRSRRIGHITLEDDCAYAEIPMPEADRLVKAFEGHEVSVTALEETTSSSNSNRNESKSRSRNDRNDRGERGERSERNRSERGERNERSDRSERNERNERNERRNRRDKNDYQGKKEYSFNDSDSFQSRDEEYKDYKKSSKEKNSNSNFQNEKKDYSDKPTRKSDSSFEKSNQDKKSKDKKFSKETKAKKTVKIDASFREDILNKIDMEFSKLPPEEDAKKARSKKNKKANK